MSGGLLYGGCGVYNKGTWRRMKGSGFDSSMGCRMISEVWRFGLGSLRASRRIIEGLFLLRCCGQPQRETRAGATHSFQIHAAHVLGFYDRLSRANEHIAASASRDCNDVAEPRHVYRLHTRWSCL